jgi:RNA-directed DNA polymerase
VKVTGLETEPAPVSAATKQAGDIRDRWSWAEPSVWTQRMLTALETGVKGGKWFSLMDKVYSASNLQSAWRRVQANGGSAGVDHESVEQFDEFVEGNLEKLREQLKEDKYHPKAIRRTWIPKPGSNEKRPLGIPTVRDRVTQAAVLNVLEPIYEKDFAERSYGFRPGRCCKDALRQVAKLLEDGYTWVVDADLKGYFDNIPKEGLMQEIAEKIADGRVLKLIRQYLDQEILESMKRWKPEKGTPQGAVLSPLLSNIYLNPLDHMMEAEGIEMVRYADDFVLLCRSEREARCALRIVEQWVEQAGLTLHPEKTHIVDATIAGGFDFLGYHFERGYQWPRKKSMAKFKDTVRYKTKRTNGHSLQAIIADVNRTSKGWFEYFKHSHKTTFPRLDSWIRMRLRSILRKRQGKKGKGRGSDHHRWPNAFFAAQGLFSLHAAHGEACQSARR